MAAQIPPLPDDFDWALGERVNLLLVGPQTATRRAVGSLGLRFRQPVMTRLPGEPLGLPAAAEIGTLVVHDIPSLTVEDQQRLFAWLDQATGRTRVISTCPGPMSPIVAAGAFDEALYYRLNTVCLNLIAWPDDDLRETGQRSSAAE